MSLGYSLANKKQVVHWLVLLPLLLGQFALGFGYGIAAERGNEQIRIPVCTNTGIQYIIWTPDGINKNVGTDAGAVDKPHASSVGGNCTLCTVSPPQIRFDVQDTLLPEPIASQIDQIPQTSQQLQATSVLNLRAAPRAPPSV